MSDANDRKLAKTTAIIAVGNISTKCVNFLLLPFYTAYITKEVYGTVDLLSTYVTLLLPFVNLQLWNAAFSFLAKCRTQTEREREVISNAFFLSIVMLVFFLLIGSGIYLFWGKGVYLFLLFSVPAEVFLSLTTNMARGLGRNAVYASGNFLSSLSTLLMNVFLLAVLRLPAIYILIPYVIGPILGGLYAFFAAGLWQYSSIRYIHPKACKEILRFSVPMIPNEVSWWVLQASDRTILAAFIGISATGIIAVANRFSAIYATIYNVFYYAWVEQCLTLYQSEGGDQYLSTAVVRMWRLFGCLSMLFISSVSIAFQFMVNRQYAEAYGLVALYGLAAFAKVMIGLTEPFLIRDNRTGLISASAMAAGVVNLAVDLLLVRRIGVYAAPISSFLAFLIVAAWRVQLVHRRYCPIRFSWIEIGQVLGGFLFSLFAYYQSSIFFRILSFILLLLFCCFINRKDLWGLKDMAWELMKRKGLFRGGINGDIH